MQVWVGLAGGGRRGRLLGVGVVSVSHGSMQHWGVLVRVPMGVWGMVGESVSSRRVVGDIGLPTGVGMGEGFLNEMWGESQRSKS